MALFIMLAMSWGVSLAALLLGAATDLKDRIIPNKLVLLIAASGLTASLVLRPELVWVSLLGAVLVLVGLGVLSHYDLLGGGDVKLVSALTLLVPPHHIGVLLIAIALAGGALGCIYYTLRCVLKRQGARSDPSSLDRPPGGFQGLLTRERTRIAAGEPMPYALAVLGGVAGYIAGVVPQCLSATSCSL